MWISDFFKLKDVYFHLYSSSVTYIMLAYELFDDC